MEIDGPLVSVVIPAFNAARTIQETLQSVTQQSYTHLDVIVIDDGSTDETAAIATLYGKTDARFRVISKSNEGVASARNAGIREAKGQFIAFIDADDLWHPTKIEKQLKALLSAGADTALVYSPFRMIDAGGRVFASPHKYGVSGWVIHRHFFTNFVGNGSALLVRKHILEEFGGFDTWLRHEGAEGCEDLLLQLRIAARYRFGEVAEYLVGYRKRPDSMSSDTEQMVRSGILAVNTALSECIAIPSLSASTMLQRYQWQRCKTMMRKARTLQGLALFAKLLLASPSFVASSTGSEVAVLTGKLGRFVTKLFRRPGAKSQRPRFYDLDPRWGIDLRHDTPASRALRRLARFDQAYRPPTTTFSPASRRTG